MKKSWAKQYGIFATQLVMGVLFSLGFYWLAGMLAAKSYFLGGLAWLIPAAYFALGARKITPGFSNKKMLRYFFFMKLLSG